MTKFIAWFTEKNFISVRSFSLYITLWMTWQAFTWAGYFALHTDKVGVEVAAIIAAVTAPITALQGWIFKVYSDSRK